ncbi:hypothetical protein SacmaDRAFT_2717 [Saccharomonospora marina XMU15]|uniref:Uncharacterized protein n=1 Tax=Saccharomonospora marina XMU15 TaxID=882083 RepID=H5X2L9_9PSEU|nr:hypothetical protein [Saccharomonospora marina]EHR50958.1 hypothetical protein SacmaDRAFT_2717 [Saccharomonospora marina XMU15]
MHVLVTEANFGDSARVLPRLRDLGCRVSTCHTATGLCRALEPGSRCPLDEPGGVDLLVDVRSVGEELTAREFGAVCAVRARVPTAVTDADTGRVPTVPIGLENHVTAVPADGLADACRGWLRARGNDAERAQRRTP